MEPVKIGLLLPSSGVDTAQGTDATKGVELYLSQTGSRAGGRELQLVKEDDRAKPDVAREKLRKLVEVDRVDFVIGPISSAVVLAIRDYVHESGVPLLVPAAFTRLLTSPQQASPSIFRLSDTSDQSNYPMGEWLVRHSPYRRMVVLAADFAGGRHSVEAFMAGFRAAGGEIAAEIYPPFDTSDFSPYLKQVAAARGDAIYAWFAGGDAVRFVTQYRESGLDLPLTGHSALVGETLLPLIGDAALGITAVGAYSAALRTPENQKFVRDYEAAYQDCPSRYSECGWDAAALISTAVGALNGDLSDRGRLRKALRDALPAIEPPRGSMRFDDYRQVITPIYFTRTEKQDGRMVNRVIDSMPAVSQESTWGWWNKQQG
jgi:branched-chain amino acid transport system substrate-binding protein